MKFIIEPINDTDCRIVGIDCSGLQGQAVDELTIPATVEQDGKTYRVKEVGDGVCHTNKFDDNAAKYAALRRLKKLIFSEGIEVIEGVMYALGSNVIYALGSNAENRGNGETLKEVVLPSTLKVIGKGSFCDCKQLCSINIPDVVEVIDDRAFSGCESLTWFQWPKQLRIIGNGVFGGTLMPTDDEGKPSFVLEIPDSIEQIGHITKNWRGDEVMGSPYIDAEILLCKISPKAWPVLDASGLTSEILEIDIPEGVTKINGSYRALKRVTLPSTLEEIGRGVFRNSYVLDCIQEFPPKLRSIGQNAFYSAKRADELKELYIHSAEIIVGEDAFAGNKNLKIVGDEAVMKNLMAQPGALNGTLIEAIDIPEGATEIYVRNCPELKSITLPSTATTIKKISSCPKLEKLIIPDSVTRIEEISSNDSLTELHLSANLEQLKELSHCPKIKELHLPDSLKKLNDDPTSGGGGFGYLSARIDASVDVWKLICTNKYALSPYMPASGELVIPDGVESLAVRLLSDSGFTTLRLPSTLKEIGNYAFHHCDNLKSLTIPAGVEVIPANMASVCSALESIEFAQGSQLKQIQSEAFEKTALKNVVLPDGLTTLGGEVFKDIETLETVTFPASMTDYGFRESNRGNPVTPFVRCKNLKYVVFLADNPAEAVYPVALGKLCDWYVPDNMVDHVKAFIEKAKTENPTVKGIGAKGVKPLSKLKGGVPGAKKSAAPKKSAALTQAIRMEAIRLDSIYRFPVDAADVDMLNDDLGRAILAARYLRDKISECSFTIEDRNSRGSTWIVEEMNLCTQVNSATEKQWHSTPKTTLTLDFSDTESLPEDFPTDKAAELAKHGGFKNLFAAKCENYMKELPEGAPAYLEVSIPIRIVFDFMIGEKEKFNVKKINVMNDWVVSWKNQVCWRFGFMYNGRYIPATGIIIPGHNSDRYSNIDLVVTKSPDMEEKIESKTTEIDGVKFEAFKYIPSGSLPFIDDMITLSK